MENKAKIFVDGQEGTTGLRIHEYLAARSDISILKIDPDKRKDPAERKRLLNAADVAILCLPETASREAIALIDNPRTRVIDASTAFRTDPAWAYGLPELNPAQREKIRTSTRVAVPGCHASAFLLSIVPLLTTGFLKKDAHLTCVSLTGYSGAGKKMIATYEAPDAPAALKAPRPYALSLAHKHLPEMRAIAGLAHAPIFTPIICNVHSGLAVETFLPTSVFSKTTTPEAVHAALAGHYKGEQFIHVMPFDPAATENLDNGFFDITACNNTNRADIYLFASPPPTTAAGDQQMTIFTRLDNLGKGASGAAIQCLNLMLGLDESLGLSANAQHTKA